MKFPFLLSLLITFITISCSPKQEKQEIQVDDQLELGEVDFKVSGDAAAIPMFNKGLLLLHSFEYEDAREAFQEAQSQDSMFAMAYWGEAMTYNHSLWQRQEKEEAIAALEKLALTKAERMALAKTPIEKDFFEAVEILYGEGTKYERDLDYNKFLSTLVDKYPDNHEVAAFYAVSLLGSSRNGRDEELYGKSAKIAQGILAENPKHPGALHYLIHSYDDPSHAALARNAADEYAHVAPDAAHALHMPSHIYVALGKWNEVVNSNIASWNASVKRMQRKELDNDARSYHALSWLQYGLLQRGETEKATRLLNDMIKYSGENPSKPARSYMVAMKGAHLVETNSWSEDLADIAINTDDLTIVKKAGNYFLDGMKAVYKHDQKVLSEIIGTLKKKRVAAETTVGEKGFAMCSTGGFANRPPSQLDIDMVKVMELQLLAHQASLNNKPTKAKLFFQEAVSLDETLDYSYGPPIILKPVHEAYGEWLLKNEETAEALTIFEKGLERQPRRLLSILGKKKAAALLGLEELVKMAEQDLAVSKAEQKRAEIL